MPEIDEPRDGGHKCTGTPRHKRVRYYEERQHVETLQEQRCFSFVWVLFCLVRLLRPLLISVVPMIRRGVEWTVLVYFVGILAWVVPCLGLLSVLLLHVQIRHLDSIGLRLLALVVFVDLLHHALAMLCWSYFWSTAVIGPRDRDQFGEIRGYSASFFARTLVFLHGGGLLLLLPILLRYARCYRSSWEQRGQEIGWKKAVQKKGVDASSDGVPDEENPCGASLIGSSFTAAVDAAAAAVKAATGSPFNSTANAGAPVDAAKNLERSRKKGPHRAGDASYAPGVPKHSSKQSHSTGVGGRSSADKNRQTSQKKGSSSRRPGSVRSSKDGTDPQDQSQTQRLCGSLDCGAQQDASNNEWAVVRMARLRKELVALDTCSASDKKKALRQLQRELHPDKQPPEMRGSVQPLFHLVQREWEIDAAKVSEQHVASDVV